MDGTDTAPPLRTRELWEPIRLDYSLPHMTMGAISRKYGVPVAEILDRARTHKWQTERTEFTDRLLLIGQLMSALELQIERLEKDMAKTTDKDVTTLGRLTATFDKLLDIGERSQGSPAAGENMKQLRNKLAQRIENLQSE